MFMENENLNSVFENVLNVSSLANVVASDQIRDGNEVASPPGLRNFWGWI